jgi:hypothetical protein
MSWWLACAPDAAVLFAYSRSWAQGGLLFTCPYRSFWNTKRCCSGNCGIYRCREPWLKLCSISLYGGNTSSNFLPVAPYLPDPDDDMLLELAVTAQCDFIVTYNTRDFVGVERFALRVIEPGAFLQHIGALP